MEKETLSEISEVLINDFKDFTIKGKTISLISDYIGVDSKTVNTVGEIDGSFYYLGEAPLDFESAVIVYEAKCGTISGDDLYLLLQENKLK